MCGICGAIGFADGSTIVRQMNQAMVHRGPDSAGFLDYGPIHLGMRRLRIIDLNTGDQPIYNQERTTAIVFNGEIYNFRELYRELQSYSHRFATHSDTEVILHAWEQWGTDCPKHLRGMFAFAIYDCRPVSPHQPTSNKRRLFLARDRLGVKPLYLWQEGSRFLFASEVRALLAGGQIPKNLSMAGLSTYLSFGSVQEPLTMVEGVTSLPPASWLQVDFEDGRLQITRATYWQPPLDGERNPEPEQVRAWLADAVQSHLMSDVPLGAFLSGGLDSGGIVGLGSQVMTQPMRTFTLAFNNWPDDERELAGLTAQRWQTNHQKRVITPKELLTDIPQAIASMDQPTADGVNSWFVSREARRAGLVVALSGLGGDELFAGYPGFHQVPRLKRLIRPGGWLRKLPGYQDGWAWLPGSPDGRRKLSAFLANDLFFDHPYFAVRALFTSSQVENILRPDINEQLQAGNEALGAWRQCVEAQVQLAGRYDEIGEISWLELCQYMRSTLLRDADMMSMAHSLEVRVPFVDHLLIEHILPISGKYKIKKGQSKPLLASALKDLLPPEVITSAKRTFTFPFEIWLRQSLSLKIGQRFQGLSGGLGEWIDPTAAAKVWQDFERGRTNWARPWALYVLDAWVRQNL